VLAHAGWVGRLTHDDALADALIRKDVSLPSMTSSDREMLRYAEKLTLRPGTVEGEDVEALRKVGFSDAAIVDVAAHVALFSLMNRIVDGLGGQLEGDMPERARRYGLALHPGTYE
jgi:uncharacterized peroxidase-related enzyme